MREGGREREIASLWKRRRFILSIFGILCNIILFYLSHLIFSREDKRARRGFENSISSLLKQG